MSGLEIERKFLVRHADYKRQAFSSSHIQQGYICSGHGRTVRVRIRDDRGYITIKGPSDEKGDEGEKQGEGGKKILEWSFGVLIVLAILFVIYSIWIVA